MDTSHTATLLSYVFPKEIVERFDIVAVEEDGDHQLIVRLTERNTPPIIHGVRVESKGFHRPQTIYDYPLRDRAMTLVVQRRRWRNAVTGKDLHTPSTLTAEGTSYTIEFGAFLKEDH